MAGPIRERREQQRCLLEPHGARQRRVPATNTRSGGARCAKFENIFRRRRVLDIHKYTPISRFYRLLSEYLNGVERVRTPKQKWLMEEGPRLVTLPRQTHYRHHKPDSHQNEVPQPLFTSQVSAKVRSRSSHAAFSVTILTTRRAELLAVYVWTSEPLMDINTRFEL